VIVIPQKGKQFIEAHFKDYFLTYGALHGGVVLAAVRCL
jgi:hypothetical protein